MKERKKGLEKKNIFEALSIGWHSVVSISFDGPPQLPTAMGRSDWMVWEKTILAALPHYRPACGGGQGPAGTEYTGNPSMAGRAGRWSGRPAPATTYSASQPGRHSGPASLSCYCISRLADQTGYLRSTGVGNLCNQRGWRRRSAQQAAPNLTSTWEKYN